METKTCAQVCSYGMADYCKAECKKGRKLYREQKHAHPAVVHCDECEYGYCFEPWEGEKSRYCRLLRFAHTKDSDLCVNADDYCSFGKKKSNLSAGKSQIPE